MQFQSLTVTERRYAKALPGIPGQETCTEKWLNAWLMLPSEQDCPGFFYYTTYPQQVHGTQN